MIEFYSIANGGVVNCHVWPICNRLLGGHNVAGLVCVRECQHERELGYGKGKTWRHCDAHKSRHVDTDARVFS